MKKILKWLGNHGKHSKPVVALSPTSSHKKEEMLAAIQEIKDLQKLYSLEMDWKELRDEGKK